MNRSGLSRANKCVPCKREEVRLRMQKYRLKHGLADLPDEGEKECRKCGVTKPLSEFYRAARIPGAYEAQCKDCRGADRRDRWAENRNGCRDKEIVRRSEWSPERRQEWLYGQWVYHLKRDFQMSPEQYNDKLEAQGGVCALCRQPEDKVHHASGQVQRLAVDHDHKCCPTLPTCGRCNRGLLCTWCNTLLGKVEARGLEDRFVAYLTA